MSAAVAASPAARYATASVGIVAAVELAVRASASPARAVLGGTIMLASMVLLGLVKRAVIGHDRSVSASLRWPTIALAWGVVCATIVVLALLISTTFWGKPGYYRGSGLGFRGSEQQQIVGPRDGQMSRTSDTSHWSCSPSLTPNP